MELDAGVLRNAAVLAATVAQRPAPVDYLVLTAGIATTQGYTPTDEGLDQKLAIHYFGRMKIVEKLLPLMRGSPDARVLTVLSGGVHSPYTEFASSFDLKDKCVFNCVRVYVYTCLSCSRLIEFILLIEL